MTKTPQEPMDPTSITYRAALLEINRKINAIRYHMLSAYDAGTQAILLAQLRKLQAEKGHIDAAMKKRASRKKKSLLGRAKRRLKRKPH